MVGVEGIAEWIGREVVDREGEKAGKLVDVYYDTTDHTPVFVSIKTGAFGRSHPVAPLTGATLSRDYVRLDASKQLIKDAPQDASGGRLTGVDAVAVLRHFALPAGADLDGETRVCFQTAGAEEETERKRAEVEAEQARDAVGPREPAGGAAGGAAAATQAPRAEPARPPAATARVTPTQDEDVDSAPGDQGSERAPRDGDGPAGSRRDGEAPKDTGTASGGDDARTSRDQDGATASRGEGSVTAPARSQAPAPTAERSAAPGDSALARLEELERRVAALEARR